jgi:hypothetical protein
MVKKALTIFTILITLNCISQGNVTFVFDFDSTKIYLKYSDILTVLKKENAGLKNKSNLITKHDSIYLDRYFLYSMHTKDSSSFDLDKELFDLTNKKIGIITFYNKIIKSYYTKSITDRRGHFRLYFKGVYYYDYESKKHFLTKTNYQRWYTPNF